MRTKASFDLWSTEQVLLVYERYFGKLDPKTRRRILEDARLNGWVYVDIRGRDIGSFVAEAKSEVGRQLVLPAGYALTWSGQYEYMERAKARLAYVVPLTIAIIVLLLYLAFRRFQEVLLILTTLPLAVARGRTVRFWYMKSSSPVIGR